MDLLDVPYFRREFARLNERLDRLEATLDHIAAALGEAAPVPGVDPLVRDLLRAGHKLQAIKAYQRSIGVDLVAAEAFIDRWGDRIARDAAE